VRLAQFKSSLAKMQRLLIVIDAFQKHIMLRARELIQLASIGLFLSGCAFGISKKLTISGGEVISVPVYTEVPIPASGGWQYDDDEVCGLESSVDLPNLYRSKELVYSFTFGVKKHGDFPTSVKIEDVSDPVSQILLVDSAPQLEKENKAWWGSYTARGWNGKSSPQKLSDIRLQWLLADQASVRIHRYTITMNTGKNLVAYHALKFVCSTKREMRAALQ
jgi:hypothetical protein